MSNIVYAWYDTEPTEALELFFKKNYCKESDSVSDSTELFSHQVLNRRSFNHNWDTWLSFFTCGFFI